MMHWLKQLRIAFGASFLWLVCLIYFTQGFRSFVWTAVSYQLKDKLKLSPSASQFVTSIAFFPWIIKPLYGYAHIGLSLLTLLDGVLVSRSNLSLGISDKFMVLFGSALSDGVNQFKPVDGPQEIKRDSKNISELQDERISDEPQVSRPSSKFMPHFKMREKLHLGADHCPSNCIRDWRMGFKWTKLFSAALCFTVLMAHGVSGWTGEIHGRVICDVCGDSSIGPEDHVLQGAEVAVLCITKSGEVLNYQAFTNVNGIYTVAETMPESERWDACLARPISSFHHHCTHLGDGSTGVKFSYTLPSGYSHTVRPFVYRPTAAPAYCN